MIASRQVTSSLRLVSSGAALLLSSAAFFVSAPARAVVAPSCDPGCVKGYHCEAQNVTACPDIACAPGTNCVPAPCQTTLSFQCVADSCTEDSDCAENQVCVTQTSGCAGTPIPSPPPCPPGEDCKAPGIAPADCAPITTKQCRPRYELACKTSVDCGPGFTCEQDMGCGCSGSGPSAGGASSGGSADPAPPADEAPSAGGTSGALPLPPASGGTAGVRPPDTCSCTPTGTSSCRLQLQACNFNSDCPAGLICKPAGGSNPPPIDLPGAGGTSSGTAGAANAATGGLPGGGAAEPAPGPLPPAELFCVPPSWSYPPIGAGGSTGVGGEPGNPRPTPGGYGGYTGTGATSGAGNTGNTPTVPSGTGGTTGGAAGGSNTGSDDNVKTEGGCHIGTGTTSSSSSSSYGLLAALGLAGLLRRRRNAA